MAVVTEMAAAAEEEDEEEVPPPFHPSLYPNKNPTLSYLSVVSSVFPTLPVLSSCLNLPVLPSVLPSCLALPILSFVLSSGRGDSAPRPYPSGGRGYNGSAGRIDVNDANAFPSL